MDEEMVLCAASAYEREFYLNPEFNSLPEEVKQELQIMCVLYTADVGGILMVVYDENGNFKWKRIKEKTNDVEFIFLSFFDLTFFSFVYLTLF